MTSQEIHDRCERGLTLLSATGPELTDALTSATREVHRYALGREISYRGHHSKTTSRTDGMTKNRFSHTGMRVPTKKELR